MVPQRVIESSVGLFLILAITCFCVLAFKVSGLTGLFPSANYTIYATFDDIGSLKVRAPVKIGGVQIGQVERIELDPNSFRALVKMKIEKRFNQIPDDSSAGILTAGLLGDNYIAITPMYNDRYLSNGARIDVTQSAMVLEKLIGQFMYKIGGGNTETASSKQLNAGAQHAN